MLHSKCYCNSYRYKVIKILVTKTKLNLFLGVNNELVKER
jgi:hypothetical protein